MRARSLTAALAAAGLLAGCSSAPEAEPSPAESKAAAVGWSPCDGLTAAAVGRITGQPMEEQDGTTDQPRCTFVPRQQGGPAYDVSYLWFDGGLDAALDSMGAVAQQLRRVRVTGADAARLAVRTRPSGAAVTGFVQTHGLVQSVNAVQPTPYDEDALVATTRRLMAALARAAPAPS